MWTPATRRQHNRESLRYETDLTDREWNLIAPMMPAAAKTGRPRGWPLREIMNAIFYVMRGGIGWRLLSIYTSIWDSGTLREKVTLQLRLRAGESQLECNVWRLCERCFLFQGRPPTSNAFIGDALDTVLDRLDCKFV